MLEVFYNIHTSNITFALVLSRLVRSAFLGHLEFSPKHVLLTIQDIICEVEITTIANRSTAKIALM